MSETIAKPQTGARSEHKAPQKNSRLPMLLIILIPSVAMGLAWLMFFTGLWVPDGRTNNGDLILPPVQFSELRLIEGETPLQLEKLEGNWGVLVFGSADCNGQACQESLYKTRQVHVALGKDADRVVRLYVAPQTPEVSGKLVDQHPNIFWLSGDTTGILKALNLESWPENRFFIIDPLGNIMMGYQADQKGGDLLDDLKKLLKASNIG